MFLSTQLVLRVRDIPYFPGHAELPIARTTTATPPPLFQAQSYLLYQGSKFIQRFDANCYVALGEKMDCHDIGKGRGGDWVKNRLLQSQSASDSALDPEAEDADVKYILPLLPPALVLGIASDGLFTPNEQCETWAGINCSLPGSPPNVAPIDAKATLEMIPSPDGHDGFLLEFETINRILLAWLKNKMPGYYEAAMTHSPSSEEPETGFKITKTSVFGEAEAEVDRVAPDVMQW